MSHFQTIVIAEEKYTEKIKWQKNELSWLNKLKLAFNWLESRWESLMNQLIIGNGKWKMCKKKTFRIHSHYVSNALIQIYARVYVWVCVVGVSSFHWIFQSAYDFLSEISIKSSDKNFLSPRTFNTSTSVVKKAKSFWQREREKIEHFHKFTYC